MSNIDGPAAPPILAVVSDAGGQGDAPTGDATDDDGGLSVNELRFIDMAASGDSLESIAKVLGVTSRTLRRWRKRPEVAAATRARLTEQVSMARAILSAGAAKAATGLVSMSSGDDPAESARVSACRGVLETTLKLTEIEDLQAELAALKAQVEAMAGSRSNPYTGRVA